LNNLIKESKVLILLDKIFKNLKKIQIFIFYFLKYIIKSIIWTHFLIKKQKINEGTPVGIEMNQKIIKNE
jgi:hypothetical protein